jgi:hypothetical protein
MRRPRHSHCPEGQDFVTGKHGKLVPIHTPKLGGTCRCGPCRQRRLWTPERRAARSAAYKGRCLRPPGPQKIASRWTPDQEAALVSLLGTMDTAGIAAELTRRFGWPRTVTAVRERIKVRKLSRLTVRPWSQMEVARILGVGYERVRGWVRQGWLTGTPWHLGGGQRPDALSQAFTVADVERLLRARPGLVRLDQIRHGGLKTLAQGLHRHQSEAAG